MIRTIFIPTLCRCLDGFRTGIASIVCLGMLWSSSMASAAVVYLNGQSDPVVGYLIEDNESNIVLRTVESNGTSQMVTIQRSDIDTLVYAADPDRLGRLFPGSPDEYRDYAEELASRRIDPEAIDLAVRLCVIAAHHGQGAVRQSALLTLIDLSRSRDEEIRIRNAAFQLDPLRNRALLSRPAETSISIASLTTQQLNDLSTGLKYLRTGRQQVARMMSDEDDFKQGLLAFESLMTIESFRAACAQRSISDETRATILQMEVALLQQTTGSMLRSDAISAETWGETIIRDSGTVKHVTLATATEFDPLDCLYRDGRWVPITD